MGLEPTCEADQHIHSFQRKYDALLTLKPVVITWGWRAPRGGGLYVSSADRDKKQGKSGFWDCYITIITSYITIIHGIHRHISLHHTCCITIIHGIITTNVAVVGTFPPAYRIVGIFPQPMKGTERPRTLRYTSAGKERQGEIGRKIQRGECRRIDTFFGERTKGWCGCAGIFLR